ncbi:hypothetical protein DVH24_003076 [Malus domestica]|uniref:Uncharacterized protein n=1 Tax=Malus domestica TaxID=3750 RepID=A0A498K6H6_MALDO|nr:hypothetical protein DVH24_003076 [Malus domestica]
MQNEESSFVFLVFVHGIVGLVHLRRRKTKRNVEDKSKRKTRWTNRKGRPGGQTRKTKLDSSFCGIRRLWTPNLGLWTPNLGLDVLNFLMCEAARKKEMRAAIYEDAAVVLGWSGEVVEQGEQSSKALRSRAEQRS